MTPHAPTTQKAELTRKIHRDRCLGAKPALTVVVVERQLLLRDGAGGILRNGLPFVPKPEVTVPNEIPGPAE